MAIPRHNDIWTPALQLLSQHESLKMREFEIPLAKHFQLSEQERLKVYDSGNGKMFYDRIAWALSYLNMAGLVRKPKRAVYQVTDVGRQLLATPEKIDIHISQQVSQREPVKRSKKEKPTITSATPESHITPQEALYASSAEIRQSVYDEIIEVILSKSPRAFEELVVTLLQRMGYGGEVEGAGEVTQYSNDQGIDGIIKEDVLGFGRIYIQAKRYARDNAVGREDIHKFVGALSFAKASKGVFITTSSYTKSAIADTEDFDSAKKLVLIDGQQLAKYIYDYNLGMQVEQTIEIKKLDSDFWDALSDNA
ncbi:restriction endonuclease [Candidatus Sororendozoicomonas aggregata]|uniref:restriction endonuclease n=1 Tax=Candidatus Sororendozoicomonas aggregata TaxID=3073239 RepID=UPI002ED5CD62